MTRKEKEDIVSNYCVTQEAENGFCNTCVLEYWCSNHIIDDCNNEELDMAISLINANKSDNVNHPKHYQGKHECIDEMIALFGVEAVKHFCMCNVYKYRYRADRKNGAEDLNKAEWYMDKLIELGGVDGGR